MRFATFIGVDQTGAVVNGRPRRLPAARLASEGDGWVLESASLASASRGALLELAREDAPAVILDAVLGLPAGCWRGAPPFADAVWDLLARTAHTSGYGRVPAEAFFAAFAPAGGEKLPRRACEIVAKANSVLTTRPFQKNIQTGTFRIWKDLTEERVRWANLWPFDDPKSSAPQRPWLFEGYPSFLWSSVFGFPRRAPARFRELLVRAAELGVAVRASRRTITRVSADADLADAAVLAIGGACLAQQERLFRPSARFDARAAASEGWIVGVPA